MTAEERLRAALQRIETAMFTQARGQRELGADNVAIHLERFAREIHSELAALRAAPASAPAQDEQESERPLAERNYLWILEHQILPNQYGLKRVALLRAIEILKSAPAPLPAPTAEPKSKFDNPNCPPDLAAVRDYLKSAGSALPDPQGARDKTAQLEKAIRADIHRQEYP